MKKSKNLALLSSMTILSGAAVAFAVGCGGGSGSSGPGIVTNQSKVIVIAVDAPNKDMYDFVKAEFEKTKYHTEMGYSISFVNRDVFAALDTQTVGHTSSIVPDIFYAPQDRVTDLVQRNVVTDLSVFSPELFNNIQKSAGATQDETAAAKSFGTIIGAESGDSRFTPVSKLFGIRHNTEGIILVSNLEADALKTDLASPQHSDLAKIAKSGAGLFRLQDFWFGNGILAGYFQTLRDNNTVNLDLMSRILYTNQGKAVSGFLETDPNHEHFKQAIKVASEVYFPAWQAAYNMNAEEFKASVFAKRGIGQDELTRYLSNDMNSVQDLIWTLMKEKKINYGIIGTWDIQNALKSADAKSFVNVVNVKDNIPYLQASGSWSYLINSRNNGANNDRKGALEEVLKLIFSKESYFKYFKSDSKVPFYNVRKDEVKGLQATEATIPFNNLKEVYEGLGYTSLQEFLTRYNAELASIAKQKSNIFGTWSNEKDPKKPLDEKNIDAAPVVEKSTYPSATDESITALNASFEKSTGLRNAISAILGVELDALMGNKETWQVGKEILKSGIDFTISTSETKTDLQKIIEETKQSDTSLNVRKLEKYIFGVNGDTAADKEAILTKISKAISENKLDALKTEVFENAKKVASNLAKTNPGDTIIKSAVDLYFAHYINTAKLRLFIDSYITVTNMPTGPGTVTNANKKVSEIIDLVNIYESSLAADRVINVITSEKTIAEGGQGILKTQTNRIDQSNPQFTRVWSAWNDNTFGNIAFLKELGTTKLTQDEFGNKIVEALQLRFKALTDAINAASTTGGGIVVFAK